MKNIAIVTGASSGMGRQFVKKLDNEGLDEIWAIAPEKELLTTLQNECKTKIVALSLDLTQEEAFVAIRDLLDIEKPNVTWLCCCAGFGKFGSVSEICINQTQGMIDLNCKAYVKTTEFTLPYMKEGARIVHIASMAAFQPTAYMATYGATKAFTLSYARALRQELKPRGISVTCVCPYWTKTKFFDVARKTECKKDAICHFATMYDPEKVINKAMKDALKRKELSIYGCKSKLQAFAVKLFPHRFVMWIWRKQQRIDKKYKKEG